MDNIEYENFDMCEVAAGMLLAKEAGAKIIPAETPLADVIKENKITLSN
jgi:fructose-1,6-bisphosphatase/inositol monophosphatase family enzyme